MDHSVTVSEDGHWMIFTSEKKGGYGIADLYLSYRDDINDPLGWGEPKNAGGVINKSSAWTACPLFHKEKNIEKVYFTSNRKGGVGGDGDSYVSSYSNKTFTTPVLVKGINTADGEMHFVPDEGFIWTNKKVVLAEMISGLPLKEKVSMNGKHLLIWERTLILLQTKECHL